MVGQNEALRIPYTINKSINDNSLSLTIHAEVSNGADNNKVFTVVKNDSKGYVASSKYSETLEITNVWPANDTETHIVHTLKLYATLSGSGSSRSFTSNIIYFTFETGSSVADLVNQFVNIKYNTLPKNDIQSNGNVILHATQYEPFTLDWVYYTDHTSYQTTIDASWYLRYKQNGGTYQEIKVASGTRGRQDSPVQMRFIPTISQTMQDGATLIVKQDNKVIEEFGIVIDASSYNIEEASDVQLKLSAFGKSNSSEDRDQWIDSIGGVQTTFNNVMFDERSGWVDDSLFMQGLNTTAVVNYNPFPTSDERLTTFGRTIEIEFAPVKQNRDSDVLVRIGSAAAGHIDIKPNGAYFYIGNNSESVVHTNYKVGERIKLAFIFNKANNQNDVENGLLYIVNNGILERAGIMPDAGSIQHISGNITIGGTDSSIKVYNIRIYNYALSYEQALNNYIFDLQDKGAIISRNQLFSNSQLDFDLVKNKIDTIMIEGLSGNDPSGKAYGGLTKILSMGTGKEDSETTVNIRRTCISDPTKSFYIQKAMIRKHGQSTINYPITSLKFWLSKSATTGDVPSFVERHQYQTALNLNKNRYIMKDGAIPANKFVLQANYADSSGVHNGSLLRLINNVWYSANFGNRENPIYRLRTAPQLFASGYILTHNDSSIGEDGWKEGGYNITSDKSGYESDYVDKTWPEITGKPFPYQIRNAADSFPCAVFYNDPSGDGNNHFLGQYVFMDDKKSDFIYGERSIYSFLNNDDPFVMNVDNTKNGVNYTINSKGNRKGQDIDANRVWTNKNVLRIEIVLPNTNITSYLGMNVPTSLILDNEGNIEETSGNLVSCTEIKRDENGNPLKYYWEDYFEMIYPDPDDIEKDDDGNITKFNPNSEFVKTAQPFIDFLTWITGLAAMNVDGHGNQYTNGTVNAAALNAFKAQASQHLDLYKLAAYYVFFLRFGLVDSVERNAQLKTYDGQHWHYEPWDMDIALGNTNQGMLILDPPVSRNSLIPGTSTYMFSGRGASTSNFMWDCLEAWDEWANVIVPTVAEKLYEAGLTYENVSKIFDEEYAEKWPESLYNEAGYFKYILHGGDDYLQWLQGARTSHRHWWLSTSMNYYDSKWSCGTFKNKRVVLFVDKGISAQGTDLLTISPTSNTYFQLLQDTGKTSVGRIQASVGSPAVFDISSISFSAKDPTWIYGGLFIEDLDLSCFAKTMATVDVTLCYDDVLGANIKKLNIGIPLSGSGNTKTGQVSGTEIRISAYDKNKNTDALGELVELNVTGQSKLKNTAALFTSQDRTTIKDFYAAGTSLATFENAPSGNTFDNLILPGQTTVINPDDNNNPSSTQLTTLKLNSASWNNLEFWNTEATSAPTALIDQETGEQILAEQEDGTWKPVWLPAAATYTKQSSIPTSITTITYTGSTAKNECSLSLLLDWINAIKTSGNLTTEQLHNVLHELKFKAENINWDSSMSRMLSYDDLENIAHLNGTRTVGGVEIFDNNYSKNIKGYVVLNEALNAEQMVNIKKWFGDSAFNKSARNSQLVVDSISDSVVINIDNVTIQNSQVQLEEGNFASMTATKFLLGDSSGENIVIDVEHTNPEAGTQQMIWSLAGSQSASINEWGPSYNNTVHLQYNSADNKMRLVADRNEIGDFDVWVRVSFRDSSQNIVYSYLKVRIIGTTYPTEYNIIAEGTGIRRFRCSSTVGQDIFGLQYNTNDVSYVMYYEGQTMDLGLQIQGEYTAEQPTITFELVGSTGEIDINNSTFDTLQGNDAYIKYITSPTPHRIRISSTGVPSTGYNAYTIKMRARFSGMISPIICTMNILLFDDNNRILDNDPTNPLYLCVRDKYNTTFSIAANTNFAIYKSDLLSLEGSLDLSTSPYNAVTSLQTNSGSIFNYLPYITSVDLTGCTMLSHRFSSGIFDFSNMPRLTAVSLNGCTGLNSNNQGSNTLDLSTSPHITSIDLRNTTIGIKIGASSNINTLQLGSPIYVSITRPRVLTDAGITIQNTQSVDTLELVDVNVGNQQQSILSVLCGFNVFDKLYNIAS